MLIFRNYQRQNNWRTIFIGNSWYRTKGMEKLLNVKWKYYFQTSLGMGYIAKKKSIWCVAKRQEKLNGRVK